MARTRVSLSLDARVVGALDREVEAGRATDRSNAVEKALSEGFPRSTAGIVLCGGPPEWLRMDGNGGYRPLAEVAGRTLVGNVLQRFKAAGLGKAVVVGSRKVNSAIFEAVGNGEGDGIAVEYVEEATHAGSLNTLKLGMQRTRGTFAFAACDHYFDFDLSRLKRLHERGASLAVYAGTSFEWSKTSVVELEGTRITKYWEKPKKPPSHLVATMTGFAEPEAFAGMPPNGSLDSAFAELARKGMLNGFVVSGNFVNVHSKEDLATARKLAAPEAGRK